MLEHKNLIIRKKNILFLQILLEKSISKVHFVEKYAIGLSPGLYLVSRLRHIGSKAGSEVDIIFLLEQIKGFVRTVLTKLKLNHESLFGNWVFICCFLIQYQISRSWAGWVYIDKDNCLEIGVFLLLLLFALSSVQI